MSLSGAGRLGRILGFIVHSCAEWKGVFYVFHGK